MSTETVYRFFVREKAEGGAPALRRVFLTRTYLSEAQATERYEVVERVEHTARRRQKALPGDRAPLSRSDAPCDEDCIGCQEHHTAARPDL